MSIGPNTLKHKRHARPTSMKQPPMENWWIPADNVFSLGALPREVSNFQRWFSVGGEQKILRKKRELFRDKEYRKKEDDTQDSHLRIRISSTENETEYSSQRSSSVMEPKFLTTKLVHLQSPLRNLHHAFFFVSYGFATIEQFVKPYHILPTIVNILLTYKERNRFRLYRRHSLRERAFHHFPTSSLTSSTHS